LHPTINSFDKIDASSVPSRRTSAFSAVRRCRGQKQSSQSDQKEQIDGWLQNNEARCCGHDDDILTPAIN